MQLKQVLERAADGHAAAGHFNVSDMVGFKAVILAAHQLEVPVPVGVSEGERNFTGVEEIAALPSLSEIRDSLTPES